MYSNRRWISKAIWIALSTVAVPYAATGQVRHIQIPRNFLTPLADEARDVFNTGQRLYDEDNFAEAEKKFREVVQRFPRHAIADRADYYLIRTLTQLGKRLEAISRINTFGRSYPRSRWSTDVEELRIRLTNQVPPAAERVLLIAPPPPAPPAPVPAVSSTASRTVAVRQRSAETPGSEIGLQQEIMRAMFRSDVNRALEIATERLKSNMADPLVMSTLNMLATSASAQALPMLLEIAKNSPNAKARKDAIFWMSQTAGDKDSIVDALVQLSSSNIEDSDSINFALSQIQAEKAMNALATISRDRNKPDATRQNALFWLAQSRVPNRISLLEDIFKNSTDSPQIRNHVLFVLSATRDPRAAAILGNIAANDSDTEIRRQAIFWLGNMKIPQASQTLENLLRKK
ncbi:MAG TPA: HEAT repeat domain-containing protein [Terriglobia bacterium]|nr:HEAT repeat domain-containing protein [Terriglobia bacterium]